MYLDQLQSILSHEGIIPGKVPELETVSKNWFYAEPSVVSFVIWSVFSELLAGWDDPQGIPTMKYQPFLYRFLPELRQTLDAVTKPEESLRALNSLVVAFRDCLVAAAAAQP